MPDGGYDDAYSSCSCLWGTGPAEFVIRAIEYLDSNSVGRAIDLGCGEGKNSAAIFDAGYSVAAIDISEHALENATTSFPNRNISWVECDIRSISGPADYYDLTIATGSLHCLGSHSEIEKVVAKMKTMTRRGGMNVLSSFNDGPQDMAGHCETFNPTLISHGDYLNMYSDWQILDESSTVQSDSHPHNLIVHSHAITRILAIKV